MSGDSQSRSWAIRFATENYDFWFISETIAIVQIGAFVGEPEILVFYLKTQSNKIYAFFYFSH